MHSITLCCAHSVESMVEEVARNLRGLGFRTNVVCGGEARDAIVGRQREHDEPTIYVVCVQGALKDTVLKPLRSALATHGGPNEHLFVAVLDLSLPLSMVGQIRRFAEAIERMPGVKLAARTDGLGERRQWREHIGPTQMNDVATRTYRSLKVVELEGTDRRDPVAARAKRPPEPTGPRPIVSQRKPAKIQATRKYKAVTGPTPMAAPSVGRKGVTVPYGAEASGIRRHRIQVPGIETKTVAEPARRRRKAAAIGSAITAAPKRSRAPIFLLFGALAVSAGALVVSGNVAEYIEAVRGGAAGLQQSEDEVGADAEAAEENAAADAPVGAAGEPEPVEADEADQADADEADQADAGEAEHAEAGEAEAGEAEQAAAGEPEPEEAGEADQAEPDEAGEASPTADADVLVVEEEEDEEGEEPDDAGVDPKTALASAIASGKIRATDRLYILRNVGEPTTFAGALRRCKALEIEGVRGWRLPHRRELRLMGAIGMLRGNYWSRATDGYDPAYALVYESNARRFATWAKSEPGGRVVCVRRK
jgi:hypothetical protein